VSVGSIGGDDEEGGEVGCDGSGGGGAVTLAVTVGTVVKGISGIEED
jgi:hypothetical protein